MLLDTAYLIVVDGFADAEVTPALTAMRTHCGVRIATIGIGSLPVISASGLRVIPEATLAMTSLGSSSIVILPGAELWERSELPSLSSFLLRAQLFRTPIGAIGSAIGPLLRAGLLRATPHARPSEGGAIDSPHLRDTPVVVTSQIITACHQAPLPFAAALLERCGLSAERARAWLAAESPQPAAPTPSGPRGPQ
jgi:transcriptional regulator GlxA family with amidase domain